jgi:hypothetical protein
LSDAAAGQVSNPKSVRPGQHYPITKELAALGAMQAHADFTLKAFHSHDYSSHDFKSAFGAALLNSQSWCCC